MSSEEPPRETGTQTVKAMALVLVVAAIAVLLLRHTPSTTSATASAADTTTVTTAAPTTTTAASATTTTVPAPLVAPTKIKLQVLNGLQAGTLAGEWSTKLHANPGYVTLTPNNTLVVTDTSRIYVVRHGFFREGLALARVVGLPQSAVHAGAGPAHLIPAGVASQADLILIIGTSLQAKA